MVYICNPLNIEYKYQFHKIPETEGGQQMARVSREAADPSLVLFNNQYYLFISMTKGFLVSDDLIDWTFYPLKGVPAYDYAPDVRVIGDYLYFSASKNHANCSIYRTKDPISGEFEEFPGDFPFWDPNLFQDDDGKIYFYWGCSNAHPIYGVELNPETMQPKTAPLELIGNRNTELGFERIGDDHTIVPKQEEMDALMEKFIAENPECTSSQQYGYQLFLSGAPYIEGAWMTKYKGKYYLQYAMPGTEFNVYGDGTYVSTESPLGPFTLAANNPFSYKPGGFITGAGHGSTLHDKNENWWHTATMRISKNHMFERRIGLWPAGFDEDGELFSNQHYGDWPMDLASFEQNLWKEPEWMLLSYNKATTASSFVEGKEASKAVNEDVRSWWMAESNKDDEWLEVDLGKEFDVHAIQLNFADDVLIREYPKAAQLETEVHPHSHYIDEQKNYTRWLMEGSIDGEDYFVIEDKSQAEKDLAHDLVVKEEGFKARFIRYRIFEVPYQQNPCISGLRVFGKSEGALPEIVTSVKGHRQGDIDLILDWEGVVTTGYNVLWGYQADKLYHSYMVFEQTHLRIGALMKGEPIFVRVDSFNEAGITHGAIYQLDNQTEKLVKLLDEKE